MNINNLLCDMADIGDIEAVRYALYNGADIHADNDYALRYASYNGHTETVKLLLDHGANAEVLNEPR